MAQNLHTLVVTEGSKKEHFRRGQGLGSGNGKTAGKGQKGQGAHAHTKKHGFEGGQMPLARRLPKYGFDNIARIELSVLNLSDLEGKFQDGDTVDKDALLAKGLIKKNAPGFKILGNGKLTKKLSVKANAYSAAAKKAIEALGGTAEVIE